MSQAAQGVREGEDDDDGQELTWVGAQWRMEGYCGRATPPTPLPRQAPHEQGLPAAGLRPVAAVRRCRPSQGRVVRIGPPRAAA
jgi:hypothetical protein